MVKKYKLYLETIMRSIKYIIIAFFLCLSLPSVSSKVGYRTNELRRLATVLHIQTDKLQVGYQRVMDRGESIVLHVNEDSEIDHIGLSLFPEYMKKMGNKVVMEFIERYMLQLQYPPSTKTPDMMMRDDNVKLTKGNLSTLKQLLPTDKFNLSCELFKYTATWQRDEKTILCITFPAEFELLRGINFIEAQQLFEGDSRKDVDFTSTTSQLDKKQLKGTSLANCYLYEGGYYLNKQLNANRYYIENKNGKLQPLLSDEHPVESIANLMLCPEISDLRQLIITERLYGFQTKDFQLPLKQWITFCMREHCEMYFGVQEVTATAVKATVIAVNTAENYNHMLTLTIPFTVITDPEGVIKAQLNCYLPTHNIRNLFGKDNSKKKAKYHL